MRKTHSSKNRIKKAVLWLLSGLLLLGGFRVKASATVIGFIPEKKTVSAFLGTTDGFAPELHETATLPKISFAADCPGEIDPDRSFYALHIGEEWKGVTKDSVFTPGEWRLEITIRVRSGRNADSESAGIGIDPDFTVELDGERFETDGKIHDSGSISTIRAFSQPVTLLDETCNHSFEEGLSTAGCSKPGKRYYTCTECGYVKTEDVLPTGDHLYQIVSDGDSCYKICQICGVIAEKQEHEYRVISRIGDCGGKTVRERCIRCGDEKTETVAEAHTFSEVYVFDEENHYKVCVKCLAKGDMEPHNGETACTVCGYGSETELFDCPHGPVTVVEEEPVHTYGWLTEMPEEGDCESKTLAHLVCLGCGQWFVLPENGLEGLLNGEAPIPAEPESLEVTDGEHEYENDCADRCDACGALRTVTHNFETEWASDGFMHFKECKDCGAVSEASPHEITDWIVEKDGKCTGETVRHLDCAVCGLEIARETRVLGHDFGPWTVKDPTCTKEGYAEQTCAECKNVRRFALAPLGHIIVRHSDYTVDNITGEITPESYICEVCKALFADEEGKTLLSEGIPEETEQVETESEFPWRTVLWVSLLSGGVLFVGFGVLLLLSSKNREKRGRGRKF